MVAVPSSVWAGGPSIEIRYGTRRIPLFLIRTGNDDVCQLVKRMSENRTSMTIKTFTCSRTEAGATLPEALLPYHFPLWKVPPLGSCSSVIERLSSSGPSDVELWCLSAAE